MVQTVVDREMNQNKSAACFRTDVKENLDLFLLNRRRLSHSAMIHHYLKNAKSTRKKERENIKALQTYMNQNCKI